MPSGSSNTPCQAGISAIYVPEKVRTSMLSGTVDQEFHLRVVDSTSIVCALFILQIQKVMADYRCRPKTTTLDCCKSTINFFLVNHRT